MFCEDGSDRFPWDGGEPVLARLAAGVDWLSIPSGPDPKDGSFDHKLLLTQVPFANIQWTEDDQAELRRRSVALTGSVIRYAIDRDDYSLAVLYRATLGLPMGLYAGELTEAIMDGIGQAEIGHGALLALGNRLLGLARHAEPFYLGLVLLRLFGDDWDIPILMTVAACDGLRTPALDAADCIVAMAPLADGDATVTILGHLLSLDSAPPAPVCQWAAGAVRLDALLDAEEPDAAAVEVAFEIVAALTYPVLTHLTRKGIAVSAVEPRATDDLAALRGFPDILFRLMALQWRQPPRFARLAAAAGIAAWALYWAERAAGDGWRGGLHGLEREDLARLAAGAVGVIRNSQDAPLDYAKDGGCYAPDRIVKACLRAIYEGRIAPLERLIAARGDRQ